MNSGQGKIFLNKIIKCVRHKRLSLMILKLEISVNKITIKIMEEQAFIWNEVFPIYINKKELKLQIHQYLWQKKSSKELCKKDG